MFDDDVRAEEEEGGGGCGEEARVNVGDAVEEVRDGVLERIRLAAVGDWTVDFDIDVSLTRADVIVLVLEVLFIVELDGIDWLGGGFAAAFVKRWETWDDEDDELALIVDAVGLIERLRDAIVVPRYCCDPGAVGRGMKPKRVCIVVGGGARFVIDIGLVVSKDLKIKTTIIIERKKV